MDQMIVKNFKGLPLAAKAIGSLLFSKLEEEEWKSILRTKIWELPVDKNILPALSLSYKHLPSHLKYCFVFCSIFHKDFIFDKDRLSFFEFEKLRSLLLLKGYKSRTGGIPDELFLRLRCLHVLKLRRRDIKELSNSIESLIQLRYLDLADLGIRTMAQSITPKLDGKPIILLPGDHSSLQLDEVQTPSTSQAAAIAQISGHWRTAWIGENWSRVPQQRYIKGFPSLIELTVKIWLLLRMCVTDCADFHLFLEEGLPTALESLGVFGCYNLLLLPAKLQELHSLKSMVIGDCQQVRCSPDKGLPMELKELCIYGCPLLKEYYLGDGAVHIPRVQFEDAQVSGTEAGDGVPAMPLTISVLGEDRRGYFG
ncbi:hypothetical protein BHM03_00012281 [Ensete ventricosum]|nr:hypothetical protein BHM03_00012281 [Ensete ventricosum]